MLCGNLLLVSCKVVNFSAGCEEPRAEPRRGQPSTFIPEYDQFVLPNYQTLPNRQLKGRQHAVKQFQNLRLDPIYPGQKRPYNFHCPRKQEQLARMRKWLPPTWLWMFEGFQYEGLALQGCGTCLQRPECKEHISGYLTRVGFN